MRLFGSDDIAVCVGSTFKLISSIYIQNVSNSYVDTLSRIVQPPIFLENIALRQMNLSVVRWRSRETPTLLGPPKVLFLRKIRFLVVCLSHSCDSSVPITVKLDNQEYDLDLKLISLVQKGNLRPNVMM